MLVKLNQTETIEPSLPDVKADGLLFSKVIGFSNQMDAAMKFQVIHVDI